MPTTECTESKFEQLDLKITKSLKYKLYLGRALSAWDDRMWQYAIGLYFIKLLLNTFLLATIHRIISSLILLLVAPIVGLWIERTERFKEIQISLFLRNGFVALGALCVAIFELELFDENTTKWIFRIGLIVFSIIAQIWSVGFSICLEKDWILCIANNDSQLTELNAILRRIELVCSTIAFTIVGLIMDRSLFWSAIFIFSWSLISAGLEYFLLKSIYKSVPTLQTVKNQQKTSLKLINMSAFITYGKSFLWPGISLSLLYLTVLGFDSVTTDYASEKGVNETTLILVRVGANVAGVIGIIFYPILVKRFGVKTSSLIGFICAIICLTLCLGDTAKFLIPSETIGIILLLAGITAARFGLLIADIGINQLIQTETASPPLISSVQTSVNTSMELFKFIVVSLIPEVNQFYILVLISYGSVLLATILFCLYVFKSRIFYRNKFYINPKQISD